ncbi:MAG: LAGLIDADG endonuclease [Candidatus Saccharibacteria bacterium]
MRSKEIEEYKLLLKLTKRQRSIIVGTILGDGHLETLNNGRTYRLKIEHSIKQSAYVDWLYQELKPWVLTPPKAKSKLLKGISLENYYFQTLSAGQLRFYGKAFYDVNKKKHVPAQVGHWLTPLALAVWFMDDGSSKSKQHRAIILNTQGFTSRDIKVLQEALMKGFTIEAKIRRQKESPQLLIVGESAEHFYKLVQPYVLPSFSYKFGALVNILPKEYRRRSKVS